MKVVDANNDYELLVNMAKGSEKAFARLFDLHKNNIYAHAFHFTQSVTIAEEITQDVFLTCWMKRDALPEIINLQAWLFTITKNNCFNHLKKMARQQQLSHSLALAAEPRADENIESYLAVKEQQGLLQKAIETLSDKQRLVFGMNRDEGMKNSEIAEQLNISPNTVKTHMVSAIRSIRVFFKAHAESAIQVLMLLHLMK